MIPEELKYSETHEWIKVEGDTATIGITDHAQKELGDVVFAELPAAGKELSPHQEFGVVESVKSVSSLYSPVSGKVIEANQGLPAHPEIINQDCYGRGWMIKIKLSNIKEVDSLLSAKAYQDLAGSK